MKKSKQGTIVSFDEYAVRDYFCNANLVTVQLKTQSGDIIKAKVRPDHGFALEGVSMSQKVAGQKILKIDQQARADLHRKYRSDPMSPVKPDSMYYISDVRIRAAIGDVLRIGWDYGNFTGIITEMAADRSNQMEWSYPIKKRQAYDEEIISDSLGGLPDGLKRLTASDTEDSAG